MQVYIFLSLPFVDVVAVVTDQSCYDDDPYVVSCLLIDVRPLAGGTLSPPGFLQRPSSRGTQCIHL